jgi:hypothetical protein
MRDKSKSLKRLQNRSDFRTTEHPIVFAVTSGATDE